METQQQPPESSPTLAASGSTYPTIELGDLLHQYTLSLVIIAGSSADTDTRPVRWVHSSELEDPTPFLPSRTVLLTTGGRFSEIVNQAAADAYVQRLIDAETTALGVAVGLHWDRVPTALVNACDRLGFPLFRVPYDTPFIAVVQAAARLLDARLRERDIWALDSQRAVTNASMHRNGLSSAIREAASRLGKWVGIADRSGRLVEFAPQSAKASVQPEWIRRETRRLIERGVSAGRIGTSRTPATPVTPVTPATPGAGTHGSDESPAGIHMQALGREGRVLGVLVVEDRGAPDHAERALLGLVTALATMQLEHRAGLDTAAANLRRVIVQLLLTQDVALAEKIAPGVLTRLPRGPVIALRLITDDVPPAFTQDLESLDAGSPGMVRAVLDDGPVILTETRHMPPLRRLLVAHRVPAGVSDRGPLSELNSLLSQANRALEHSLANNADAPVDYVPALHDGVLHLLSDNPEAVRHAADLLAPIRNHDRKHKDGIEASLRTWLSHHGQTSPAAAELGVHRHTLRARVQTAANLLQSDLDSPDTRAELWAALRLLGE